MKPCRVLSVLFLTFLGLPVYAQLNAAPQSGITPYTPFQHSDVDSVNLANGNVTVHIPVISFPQVGKDLKLDFFLRFNQPNWIANLYATAYSDPPNDTTVSQLAGFWDLADQYTSSFGKIPLGVNMVRSQGITVDDSVVTFQCYSYSLDEPYSCDGTGTGPIQTTGILENIRTRDGADHAVSMSTTNGNNVVLAPDGSGWNTVTPDDYSYAGVFQDAQGNTYTEKKITVSGTTVGYAADITDPNGNTITTNSDNSGWTDSTGRAIPGSYSGVGATPEFDPTPGVAVSGTPNCPPGSTGERDWTVPVVSGTSSTTATYYFCYTNKTASTDFAAFGYFTIDTPNVIDPLSTEADDNTTANGYFLSELILPNGTSYQFTYDSYFELTEITLPTGGTISYTWKTIAWDSCSLMNPISRVISTRTVDPTSGPSETWTYYYTPAGSSCGNPGLPQSTTTVVTKPDGNDELHVSGGGNDDTIYYNGSAPAPYNPSGGSGGTILETVAKAQALINSPFYMPSPPQPSNVAPAYPDTTMLQYFGPATSTTTTWGSGGTSLTSAVVNTLVSPQNTTFYNGGANLSYSPYDSSTYTSGTCYSCENYGLVQYSTQYDYSAPTIFTPSPTNWPTPSMAGSAIKTTVTNYLWKQTGESAYQSANLLSLPSSVVAYPGSSTSGTALAESDYAYDETTYGSPSGAHGNLTTVTQVAGTGGNGVFKNYYDSHGAMTGSYDTKMNLTTLTYQCSDSLPDVLTNAASQTTTYGYDCDSGIIKSVEDANSQTTTYSHDNMGNLTNIAYPDGGNEGISYNSYATPLTITATKKETGSENIVSSTTYDGVGRPDESVLEAPEANIKTYTTYDDMGRVATVTTPYISTSDPTYGVTSYTYDTLGRKTIQTQPDSSTLQWCYDDVTTTGVSICKSNASGVSTATWVDSSDESGNIMQHASDGLGRLVAVMEPSPSSNSLQLETDYTYDDLGNLTYVNQKGASGDTARTRSFTYDEMSRLLTSSNPETGTISYSYNTSSPCSGDPSQPCSKTDARSVTTTYTYNDPLNRLTGKSYSDGTTLSSCYAYDFSSTTNGKGRLGAEWTQSTCPSSQPTSAPSSGYQTLRSITSYDDMGRLTGEQQCPISSACSSLYSFAYTYDYAGNATSSNNGLSTSNVNSGENAIPLTFGFNYDAAGRLAQANVTTKPSSWTSSTNYPPILLQANSQTQTTLGTLPYDPLGHLVTAQLGLTTTGAAAAVNTARQYNDRARVLSETDTGQVVSTEATQSSGTITVSASGTNSAYASGSFSVSGSEQMDYLENYDYGWVQVNVGTYSAGASYGESDTPESIASNLASGINSSGAPVTATASGSSVTVTANSVGSSGDLGLSGSVETYDLQMSSPSFSVGSSGMSGGRNADTGSLTVTINSVTSGTVNWSSGSTTTSIASAIKSALQTSSFSGFLTASSSGGTVTVTSVSTGTSVNWPVTVSVTDTSQSPTYFSYSHADMTGGAGAGYAVGTIYSYSIPSGSTGYAANGNLLSYTDSVMGSWSSLAYDHLNRLSAGTQTPVSGSAQSFCWTYDDFGNRTTQATSNEAFTNSAGASSCSLAGGATLLTNQWAHFTTDGTSGTSDNGHNVLTATSLGTYQYDVGSSGSNYTNNVKYDGVNTYKYDGEGRLCAVESGGGGYTGYIYDADGTRTAKGSISSLACPGSGGLSTVTNRYLLGPGGEQVTELDGSNNWVHTNAFIGGHLLGTYDIPSGNSGTPALHFQLADWLGSRRVQTDATGQVEDTFQSLPYGDGLAPTSYGLATSDDSTEHHFTGKERDTESGLDYFGARYFASAMGRWMSPDWSAKVEPVPYAKLWNPQSLNLYAYVLNNPLSQADPDGHENDADKDKKLPPPDAQHDHTITVRQVSGQGVNIAGHATVQIDGGKEVGYGPKQDMTAKQVVENKAVPGTVEPRAANAKTEDQVTIHVTADQAVAAQKTIDAVSKNPGNYVLDGSNANNCANFAEKVVNSAGGSAPHDTTPGALVTDLRNQQYKNNSVQTPAPQ